MLFFELESNCVFHGYTLRTHHFSLYFGQHDQYSHNFEHTYINIIITKIHFIPIKHTQPMIRCKLVKRTCNGKQPQFSKQICLNLKGSLGKGTKREDNPNLFYIITLTFCPKFSPKITSESPQLQHQFEGQTLSLPNVFDQHLFSYISVSSSSVKNFFQFSVHIVFYQREREREETMIVC